MSSGKGKGKRSKTLTEAEIAEKKAKIAANGNGFSHFEAFDLGSDLSSSSVQETLKHLWTGKSKEEDVKSHRFISKPFPVCSLKNFVSDRNDEVNNLIEELNDLDFVEKSNDLYKFRQSGDLNNEKTPLITAFRAFLQSKVKPLLAKVTGIEFTEQIDMFCARYDYTDYLLCHDDELEGRRIAFIWYLVPDSWSAKDGGALNVFDTDANGEPSTVARSLLPERNAMTFFEVTEESFHEVAEVLTQDLTRLSIGGWFHGASKPRRPRYVEAKREKAEPKEIGEDEFFSWVNPLYLDPVNQSEIQENFEANSEISLQDFLDGDKFAAVSQALAGMAEAAWKHVGPADKRSIERLADDETPEIVRECLNFLQSDAFFLMLSNLTGLRLHPLAPEDSDEDSDGEDGDAVCDSDDGEDESNDQNGKEAKSESPQASTSQPQEATNGKKDEEAKVKLKPPAKDPEPKCVAEVRRWKRGSYTLIRDDDQEQCEFALDARLFLNCEGWTPECGGFSSYVAKNEDEELLSAQPASNALILVYRDSDTLKFVKRVTDEINARVEVGAFHDISVVYYE